MAINYTLHSTERYVHIEAIGPQTMPDMIAVVDAVADDPNFESGYSVIFDLLKGDYTAELRDGDDFVQALKRRIPDFQNRFALIVPKHLHALGKLYSILAALGGFNRMNCFVDPDEARTWCGIGSDTP
jgi:hypothetical protein